MPEWLPPSASAIQSGGLSGAEQQDDKYAAFQTSNYDTNVRWGFGIAQIPATSADDALVKAKAALPSVAGAPMPIYVVDYDVWACLYGINDGYFAVAFTPFPEDQSIQSSATKLQMFK